MKRYCVRLPNGEEGVMYEVPLEGGEVRVFPPNPEEGDPSTMYILDVLDVTVQVRHLRGGGTYVHVRSEDLPEEHRPFMVEVNGAGPFESGAAE